MDARLITFNELLGLIVTLSALVWLVITLCLAPLKIQIKMMLDALKAQADRADKFVTKDRCRENMNNCEKLREAQGEHGSN
jgi:hypothetical protein